MFFFFFPKTDVRRLRHVSPTNPSIGFYLFPFFANTSAVQSRVGFDDVERFFIIILIQTNAFTFEMALLFAR